MADNVFAKDIQTACVSGLEQKTETIVFPDIRLCERISAEPLLHQIQI